jgi:hypothetical protein
MLITVIGLGVAGMWIAISLFSSVDRRMDGEVGRGRAVPKTLIDGEKRRVNTIKAEQNQELLKDVGIVVWLGGLFVFMAIGRSGP